MRQVKNILFVAVLIGYIIMVTGFITEKERSQRIGALKIIITDSTENQFIRTPDIMRILNTNNFEPVGKDYRQLDLEKIESSLRTRQIIKSAEVFITEPGVVHVEISQKTPFVRVFDRYGQSFYLDRRGNIIPWSGGFSPFVLVANGYIDEPFILSRTLNIMDARHDSIKRSLYTIYDVYKLAEFITDDDFWNSQIEQIYVNNKYEFELIPRVGSQVIELGKVEDLDEKFGNLRILYEKGLNNIGWNQYEKISLKYKNQVVCTKNQ
jgi:cell division protein FtsQ